MQQGGSPAAAAWGQLRISIMPWLGCGNVLGIHFVCVEQPAERILVLCAHRDVAIKSSARVIRERYIVQLHIA